MDDVEINSGVGSTDSSHSDGNFTNTDSSKSDQTGNGSESNKTASSTETSSAAGSIKKELARRETEYIFRLRVMVIVLLMLVAVGVSLLVYMVTRNAEQDEFNTQFEGASTQLLEAFESIRTERISALSSVAVASIAHGVDHTRTWPFVSLSSFQQRSLTARSNSGILQVSINTWVSDEDRDEWERYAVEEEDNRWIQEAYEYQEETGVSNFILDYGFNFNVGVESQSIAFLDSEDYTRQYSPRNSGPYLPFWETSPLLSNEHINVDIFQDEIHKEHAHTCLDTGSVVLGNMLRSSTGVFREAEHNSPTARYSQLLSIAAGEDRSYKGDPMTYVYIPIFDSFRNDRVPKAVMIGLFNWARFFEDVLPPHVVGVDVVLNNHCSEPFTYQVNGDQVIPVGPGDLHENSFEEDEVMSGILEEGTIADGTKDALSFHVNDFIKHDSIHSGLNTRDDDFLEDHCYHTISVYPSQVFQDSYKSSTPAIITCAVAIIFAFAVGMFIVYDRLVERRQKLVLQKAVQSTAIVSSLFPKNVRDRLMQTASMDNDADGDITAFANTSKLKSLAIGEDSSENAMSNQPIADLFSNCTVMFADIAGFTAWSSTREPAQVFTLLQSVYQAFDKVAARRRVFKVETIGDSYVAVTGLPEPQELHAVIMAKFASECRVKLDKVTRSLEVLLGPDTGDLSMRFGLHSGPVTAGVLRGDRARFQLFGDTVNTAARMESTGSRGKIQCSPSTAECLRQAGKGMWLKPRKDAVNAKGLGSINTFWLDVDNRLEASESTDEVGDELSRSSRIVSSDGGVKNDRLVDWMTEMLSEYIKKVVAKRKSLGVDSRPTTNAAVLRYKTPEGQTNFDEVVEELTLPKFDGKGLYDTNVELPEEALAQLREYVVAISEGYNKNPFHNFDHACHVTMSVHKLLNRVTTPDISEEDLTKGKMDSNHLAARLHDYTHGINSDPMTALAVMFSALVHDVDHRGVSNVQMSKEEPDMAEFYKQKSVAEQNSLDIAWDLLMMKKFDQLRLSMFGSRQELMRFRKTFVTLVLATDIFDRELNDLRKARWERAFHTESNKVETNLRATIVLEHIIQASDVSHTMQHWHVYLKWNRRLFNEMSAAYRAGRMGSDPATFWYEGELKFFDNYIIPLAKKLQECQVFGVSSDEYLNYAQSNRMEWESKGMSVLEEMKADGVLEEVKADGILS